MAPRSRLARIQEILISLGQVNKGSFYTCEDLNAHVMGMVKDVDNPLIQRVVDYARSLGVLGRTGKHYLLRRAPDHDDFASISKNEGFPTPKIDVPEHTTPELAKLLTSLPSLEKRLTELHTTVSRMNKPDEPVSPGFGEHWLCLHLPQMPKHLRDFLRDQALQVLPTGASEGDIYRRMIIIAGKILQHACQHHEH